MNVCVQHFSPCSTLFYSFHLNCLIGNRKFCFWTTNVIIIIIVDETHNEFQLKKNIRTNYWRYFIVVLEWFDIEAPLPRICSMRRTTTLESFNGQLASVEMFDQSKWLDDGSNFYLFEWHNGDNRCRHSMCHKCGTKNYSQLILMNILEFTYFYLVPRLMSAVVKIVQKLIGPT